MMFKPEWVLALSCIIGWSVAGRAERAAVTRHEIRVRHTTIHYVAEAGRIPVADRNGNGGEIFFTSYRREPLSPLRPVVFLWNGGPGAASTALHFEAFGPRRLAGGRLVDNDTSLLTDADLVFVDPVGAGFSRSDDPAHAADFYSTLGDFAAMTQFIQKWLAGHGAQHAPLFLVGESFGVWRAAAVAEQLEEQGRKVDGIVLISGGTGTGANVLPKSLVTALRTPGRAVTALFHGRLAPDVGSDRDSVLAATTAWAKEVYAPALANQDALTAEQRDRIIAALAHRIGLEPGQIDPKGLGVTPSAYLHDLIPGKTLNLFDMRLTAEKSEDSDSVIDAYLRRTLKYSTKLAYVGLTGQPADPNAPKAGWVNQHWNYNSGIITPEVIAAARAGEGPPGSEPWALNAIRSDPKLKVLVAAGLYDSLNSCAANDALKAYLPAKVSGSFIMKCYVGGHMMYRDQPARHQLSADIKSLISSATQH